MYPDFQYLIYDIFGVNIPSLSIVKMYGFWLAIAFLVSGYLLTIDLRRREGLGLLQGTARKVMVGEAPSLMEIASNALVGFILGWKVIYLLANFTRDKDLSSVILSSQGYWLLGFGLAAAFGYWQYWVKKKEQLDKPLEKSVTVMPSDRVSDIVILAAVSGIAGSKLLYIVGVWDEFVKDPMGQLFSGSGLTVYGGIIMGFFVVSWYIRKHKIDYKQLLDAMSPIVILAYGIGRLGCHFSGDGDWGIPVKGEGYDYSTKPLSFLPDWLWAYNYPNNVIRDGEGLLDATTNYGGYGFINESNLHDHYVNFLEVPVFPTSVYELIACTLLFGILWYLRKKATAPGMLFSIFLIFNGIERFMVEIIRVNTKYNFLGMKISQAQTIALFFILFGIIGYFITKRAAKPASS